jgi:hypothetical protein
MTTDCILTTYERSSGGYGRLKIKGVKVLHNRYVYSVKYGIPLADMEGKHVLHICDNPGCVNPAHLLLGTHADNMADSADKGRKRGELAGRAKLTEEQVLAIRADLQTAYKDIAAKYGIVVPTVKDIKARKIWKHI